MFKTKLEGYFIGHVTIEEYVYLPLKLSGRKMRGFFLTKRNFWINAEFTEVLVYHMHLNLAP